MKFGMLNSLKDTKEQDDIILKICGIRQFALLPVRLNDGRWVWLENYVSYYHGHTNDDGTYDFWYTSPEDGIASYSNYADENFDTRHIWCTKRISEEDRRHDQISLIEAGHLMDQAHNIRYLRSK